MSDQILFVDDDPNLLSGIQRNLRKQFQIVTATGPSQALAVLGSQGPFALVVSDLKMPLMSGVELLARAATEWPDTVRILLTGEADMKTAIAAVNEGHVYRFLTKPFALPSLANVLTTALKQYNLVVAEKVLLERTLSGSIEVLTEILGVMHPLAFSRASRIRNTVRGLVAYCRLPNSWEFEVAAMLSQIGCITLPIEVLEKVCSGQDLSAAERKLYEVHPAVGSRLLEKIPRLETVAGMIERMEEAIEPLPPGAQLKDTDRVLLGRQLLKMASDLDVLSSRGLTKAMALVQMQTQDNNYSSELMKALATIEAVELRMETKAIKFKELKTGMVLRTDIRARDGSLLLAKNHDLSPAVLECLSRYFVSRGIQEPIEVLVPTGVAGH